VLLELFNDLGGYRYVDERSEEWEELGINTTPSDQFYVDDEENIWRVYAPSEYASISSIRNEVKHHIRKDRGFDLFVCVPRVRMKSVREVLSSKGKKRPSLMSQVAIRFWAIPGLSSIEQALKEVGR
jgi:hypothetical protein